MDDKMKVNVISTMIDTKISSVTNELTQLKEAVNLELQRQVAHKPTMGERFLNTLASMMGKTINISGKDSIVSAVAPNIPLSGKKNPLKDVYSEPVKTTSKTTYKKGIPKPNDNTPPELAAAYNPKCIPAKNARGIQCRDRMIEFAALQLNGVSLLNTAVKLDMTKKLALTYRRKLFPTLRQRYPIGEIGTDEDVQELRTFDPNYVPEVTSKTPEFYAQRYDTDAVTNYMEGDRVQFINFLTMLLDGETTLEARKKLRISDYIATKFMEAGFGTRSLLTPNNLDAQDGFDRDAPIRVVPQPVVNLENGVNSRIACFNLDVLIEKCNELNDNHVYNGVWNMKHIAYTRREQFANLWISGKTDEEICDTMGIKGNTIKNMRTELFPTWS
jgi:hypothetical protein